MNYNVIIYTYITIFRKAGDNMDIAQDRDIMALLPKYSDFGDGTVVVNSTDKDVFYSIGQRAMLNHLCSRSCKDIHLLRTWAGRLTGQSIWMPLGISYELVLVPMKIRQAKINGDVTVGYFNFNYIKDIRENKDKTILLMKDDTEYTVLWQIRTVKKHLRDAMIIHSLLMKNLDDMLWSRLQKEFKNKNIYH